MVWCNFGAEDEFNQIIWAHTKIYQDPTEKHCFEDFSEIMKLCVVLQEIQTMSIASMFAEVRYAKVAPAGWHSVTSMVLRLLLGTTD